MKNTINNVIIKPLPQFNDPRGWLSEIYRQDETPESVRPQMAYLSMTKPGVVRGPHEHFTQTDTFAFIKGKWYVKLWDNRPHSSTFKMIMRFYLTTPTVVIVPPGVIHSYANANAFSSGLVLNLPNQLYKGTGKKDLVDEIRHEDNPLYDTSDIQNQHWISQLYVNHILSIFPSK